MLKMKNDYIMVFTQDIYPNEMHNSIDIFEVAKT